MAFSSNSNGGPMADINVTPLVDVMLVLLIIFMIKVPPVTVTVKANGEIFWNDQLMTDALLEQNLSIALAREPQPQVDIRADNNTKYSYIQKVVKTIRVSGMRKVGFVSSPERD